MTQINLNLNTDQIQDIIAQSGANDLAKQMLTTIFNQLMEKERDEYINVDAYSRENHRNSSRNGYYKRNGVQLTTDNEPECGQKKIN
jgi:transposase-like protein